MDFVIAERRIQFIYIRSGSAYYSGDMADKHFEQNRRNSRGVMPRGFYFVFRAEIPIEEQMDKFIRLLRDDPGELPPTLDVERNDEDLPPAIFTAKLNEAIKYLEASPVVRGEKVALYSSAGFWDVNVKPGKIDYRGRTLWVAHYHRDPNKVLPAPKVPQDWPYWTLWQLSADGNGFGKEFGAQSYSIDIDVFNGDGDAFTKWFGVPPNEPSAGFEPDDPVANPPKYVVTKTNLNIRNGPGVTYTKIGSALKNSRWSVIEVVNTDDGLWAKVAEEVYIAYWLCNPLY
jgi:GH25 family lysozyme M1 (1,4-beta-N-acetylmuramidase)